MCITVSHWLVGKTFSVCLSLWFWTLLAVLFQALLPSMNKSRRGLITAAWEQSPVYIIEQNKGKKIQWILLLKYQLFPFLPLMTSQLFKKVSHENQSKSSMGGAYFSSSAFWLTENERAYRGKTKQCQRRRNIVRAPLAAAQKMELKKWMIF